MMDQQICHIARLITCLLLLTTIIYQFFTVVLPNEKESHNKLIKLLFISILCGDIMYFYCAIRITSQTIIFFYFELCIRLCISFYYFKQIFQVRDNLQCFENSISIIENPLKTTEVNCFSCFIFIIFLFFRHSLVKLNKCNLF